MPNNIDLAYQQFYNKNYSAAKELFKKALQEPDKIILAKLGLVQCYGKLEEWKLAEELCLKLQKEQPHFAAAFLVWSQFLLDMSDELSKAIAYAESLVPKYKNTKAEPAALLSLARTLNKAGYYQESLKKYQELKVNFPNFFHEKKDEFEVVSTKEDLGLIDEALQEYANLSNKPGYTLLEFKKMHLKYAICLQ